MLVRDILNEIKLIHQSAKHRLPGNGHRVFTSAQKPELVA